jgi:elongation factor 1-alpha
VLEGLDADPSNTSPFRVTVDEASTVEGDAVLNGRVAAGDSAPTAPAGLEGTSVTVQPSGVAGTVSSLLRNGTLDDFADAGDEVAIGVEGIDADDVRRGDVCGPIDDPPAVAASFTARLYVLDHPSVITAGYTPVVHAHTTQVACTFETLHERRAAPRGTATFDPDYIESGDFAEVTLTPQRPLAVAPVTETPELSTFTVRDMGQAIAVGIVTEVTPE